MDDQEYEYELRHHEWDIHDERESNKIGLETFTFDMDNKLDPPLIEIIKRLVKERSKLKIKFHELELKEKQLAANMKLDRSVSDKEYTDLQFDMIDAQRDWRYIEEELEAFNEVRIIYALKDLEINVKRLISASFPDTSTKQFYQWNSITDFFRSKSINMSNLKFYKEVNELREVNNFLKHSTGPDESLNKILEFKGLSYPTADAMQKFYHRVQPAPAAFLNNLMSAIYSHLYEFDDTRIAKMAEEIALRMDDRAANNFLEKLSVFYNKKL